ATLLNPAGPELLAHVTGYLDKKLLVDRTHEYMSPDFHQPSAIFFLAMLLMTLGAMMWSRRRPALHEGLLLLGFTYFALHSARNIPLFAIVVAPVLASQLRAATQPLRLGRRASAFLAASGDWVTRRNAAYARLDRGARGHVWPLVVLAVLLYVAGAQHRAGEPALGLRFDPARQPVGAAAYLKAHLPAGNGFNDLRWGGYLLRELWPAQRVFIDGQTDFYGEALTREYLRVVELGAAGDEVLQRHDVTWVVYPAGTPLVRHLLASGQWRVAYVDATASVLIRVASAEQPHASD
ncbi:MAG: hypothetical protein ACRDI2_11235, partial [Chloroflexota bacterium]